MDHRMSDEPMHREINAVIDAQPEEPDGYLVLADWLQTNGDPHGEQIVLEHAAQLNPEDRAVQRAVHQQRYRVLDPLTEFAEFVQSARMRMGFLREVEVFLPRETGEMGGRVFHFFRELFTSRAGRFVQKLTLRPQGAAPYIVDALQALSDLTLPSLRTIEFGVGSIRWASRLPMGVVLRAAPNLERLRAVGVVVDLPLLQSTQLRRLELGVFSPAGLASAFSRGAPNLSQLSLLVSQGRGLERIFAAPMPLLTELELEVELPNQSLELLGQLANSPLAAQLERIDLGPISQAELEPAAQALARFPELRSVCLRGGCARAATHEISGRLGAVSLSTGPLRSVAMQGADVLGFDSETGALVYDDGLGGPLDELSSEVVEDWEADETTDFGDPTVID